MASSQQASAGSNGISIGYGMVVLLALGILLVMGRLFGDIRVGASAGV
jgi:hypothetical protein